MTIEEKIALVQEVGEEIVSIDELKKLLESGKDLIAYDGFEPSGQIHLAQGILRAINVNKMIKAGVKFKMLVADWHAYANDKMGGDMDKIQTTGKYFIEVWKGCGMDLEHVEFVWASDLVKHPDYWKLVLQIAKTNKLKRFIRTAEIMGRVESMDLSGAQIIYPCMQTADIFMLGAHITQLGMDQRKVNMLAREIGPQLSPPAGGWKPVVVSHHMLMGLTPPAIKSEIRNSKNETNYNDQNSKQKSFENSEIVSDFDIRFSNLNEDKISRVIALKMSKSNPDSAIFMTDTHEDIKRKITGAWAPEGVVEENPILEYCKYIIFPSLEDSERSALPSSPARLDSPRLGGAGSTKWAGRHATRFTISRPDKWGGNVTYKTYKELEQDYAKKALHPMDLKSSVIGILDELLQPVRKHFEENADAAALLKQVQSFKVTR